MSEKFRSETATGTCPAASFVLAQVLFLEEMPDVIHVPYEDIVPGQSCIDHLKKWAGLYNAVTVLSRRFMHFINKKTL